MHAVVDAGYRTADVLFSEHLGPLGRRFDEKMETIIKPLVRHLWGKQLTSHYGTQLVRYTSGGHYRAHSDIGRQTLNRYYTVLCYLNDDFAGGGTHFPHLSYTVRPRAGKAIIFPSGFVHSGEAVTSGEKFVLVSWLIGPVRTLEEALSS